MTGTVLLYDPTAPTSRIERRARQDAPELNGATIGFIDNAKPNFDHLVDDLARVLIERYGVARIVRHKKRGPSMPAAGDVLDDLVRDCDLIITGSGD